MLPKGIRRSIRLNGLQVSVKTRLRVPKNRTLWNRTHREGWYRQSRLGVNNRGANAEGALWRTERKANEEYESWNESTVSHDNCTLLAVTTVSLTLNIGDHTR